MFPLSIERDERRPLLIISAIALLEVLIVFLISYSQAGNHFLFPLDDAYIHLQYARTMAAGDPLVYTAGSAPSGGMTSPLFVMLLTPLFWLGLGGAKAAFASFLFGGALWALAAIWVYQVTRKMLSPTLASAAAALLLTNGHLLWNFLSGMETGLVAVLLLGVVGCAQWWWNEERPASRLCLYAFIALLPLARPEGIVVLIAVAIVVIVRRGERPRLSLISLGLCAIPFVLWLMTLRIGTGDWRPAGMTVKSLSAAPGVMLTEKLGFAAQSVWAIPARYLFNVVPDEGWAAFKGTHFLPYFAPGFGLLALLGFGLALATEARGGRHGAGLLMALAVVLLGAAVCTGLIPFVHHQRYIAPLTPLLIVLALVAVRRIAQLFQQLESTVQRGIAIALVVTSLPSLPFWAVEHGSNARDLYNTLREATFRLQDDRRPLGITDAGVIAFYTSRQTVDLVGLTTASMAPSTLHGPGATLEALSRLPQNERPAELLTYREWFDTDFPLAEPLWRLIIPRTTSVWGTVLGLYPIDWAAIDRGDAVPVIAGARLLGEVDVADRVSEEVSGYRWVNRAGDLDAGLLALKLGPSVRFDGVASSTSTTATLSLVDGGRVVRGESFRLSSAGAPLGEITLVGRLAEAVNLPSHTPGELRLVVTSGTTGFRAERRLPFPTARESLSVWRVGPILNEVGGILPSGGGGEWHVEITGDGPNDAAWTTCHWWIFHQSAPTGNQ